jgi:hypothetical protein
MSTRRPPSWSSPKAVSFAPTASNGPRRGLPVTNPERAARLDSLNHVLPPRPGGVLALLGSIPADVVVIAHTGLDQYASFADLARAVPLRNPIHVTARRIPRDQIPDGDAERIAWLDEQWLLVDGWITRQPVNDPERAEPRRRREWCRGGGPPR